MKKEEAIELLGEQERGRELSNGGQVVEAMKIVRQHSDDFFVSTKHDEILFGDRDGLDDVFESMTEEEVKKLGKYGACVYDHDCFEMFT